ncbi:MAG: Na+/H+ antiporter NhaA [Sphingobacteriales bacterium]|nr:MAG: Na+/H+ antiporter NhaA [Sphingobacteriales bacterium]
MISPPPPKLIRRIIYPLQNFINLQVSSGIILLASLIIALIWANSPWAESYHHLWETKIGFTFGGHTLENSLHFWINDGLMTIFFFVVGLEIKREILIGELASPRKAALPIMAALGGMIAPGIIYTFFNVGTESASGWGIPMATDIAFALGVLSLLGKKVPLSLKVFLTALAIVDDMGAVVLIAVFYTKEISWMALGLALTFYASLWMFNLLSLRYLLLYYIVGLALWLALMKSGVHPTIAGVLAATTIPARPRIRKEDFISANEDMLSQYKEADKQADEDDAEELRQEAIQAIEQNCERVQPPLQRLERVLHLPVSFLIMPLFALSNAGIPINMELAGHLTDPIGLGITLGLFIGKFVGITLFVWLSVKLGLASLPDKVRWVQVFGVALLGGIGFTMSIFIANLAFTNPEFLPEAKMAILLGSLLSSLLGIVVLNLTYRKNEMLPA